MSDETERIGHNAGKRQAFGITEYLDIGCNAGTKTNEPERLSYEWHAQRAEDIARDVGSLTQLRLTPGDHAPLSPVAEGYYDLAQKLRRAAELEAEVGRLREMVRYAEWVPLDDNDGSLQCPWCGAYCFDEAKGKHQETCTYLAWKKGDPHGE